MHGIYKKRACAFAPILKLNIDITIHKSNNNPLTITTNRTIIITPKSSKSTLSNNTPQFPNINNILCKNIMDQIIPNLWLGELISVQDIIDNHFTHLLSIIDDYPDEFKNLGIKVKYIEMKDNSSENIFSRFDECTDFIHEALSSGGKVYVHCRQGLSRSPSIVIAYIMKYGICQEIHHYKFEEALQIVSEKRPNICPNLGFNLALQDYEKKIFQ
jgi:protein-tyrosine phosphatase